MKLKAFLMAKGLSNREAEISAVVARGLTNKQAADVLCVVDKTVRFHLTNIFKKLGLKSRAQLTVICAPFLIEEDAEKLPKLQPSNVVPLHSILPEGAK